jgi:hypothetical protein
MVADSMGHTFRLEGLQRQQQERYHRQWQQEQSLSTSIPRSPAKIQDQLPDVSPYPTDRTFQFQSMNSTEDEETTTLSQESRLKIEELKRLIYRYSQYHRNPGGVINCIIYYCNNGDGNTPTVSHLLLMQYYTYLQFTAIRDIREQKPYQARCLNRLLIKSHCVLALAITVLPKPNIVGIIEIIK